MAKQKEKEKTGSRPGRKSERPQLDLFAAEARGSEPPPSAPAVLEPVPELTPPPAPRGSAKTPRVTAESLATKQREISVSEFFAKNRHLLGFDNPSKALLTTIKEAVDNSLDACEEAGILPELRVEVHDLGLEARKRNAELTKGEGRFLVVVEDNGPGIVKAQVPKIFGKLLYGSQVPSAEAIVDRRPDRVDRAGRPASNGCRLARSSTACSRTATRSGT